MFNQNKIPKILHYVWMGKKEKPEYLIKNIDSWKKTCPDYQIKEWNEDNFDINKIPYVAKAYKAKKYAFVSDYVRLFALYNEGGIYLDTDVELQKDFSPFLKKSFFAGFENNVMVNLAVFGAEKNCPLLKNMLDYYKGRSFYKDKKEKREDLLPIPVPTTLLLKEYSFKTNGKKQENEGILILSKDYYYPTDCVSRKTSITPNTRGNHQYAFSWVTNGQNKRDGFVRFILFILREPLFRFFMGIYLKIRLKIYSFGLGKKLKKIKRLNEKGL